MWSRKYTCCIKCGTSEIKHKGKGLCLVCYGVNRREYYRNHYRYYYEKNKGREEFKEIRNKIYQKYKNSQKYRINQKRRHRIRKYRRIISNLFYKKGRKLKRNSGAKFRCSGCDKECLIISPINEVEKNHMHELSLFRKKLIEFCKKNNIISNKLF